MNLRGVCKMTGGKLVGVSLAVRLGVLDNVTIDGDFFLHPEERTTATIQAVCKSLQGMRADTGLPALAARIQASIPFGVELIGTDPSAIAIAVRRAIDQNPDEATAPVAARIGQFTSAEIDRLTAGWQSIPWRLIPEVPHSPAMNVALDEVLTNRVAEGRSAPCLRFWRWTQPAVIIGRCQSVLNEVDREVAEQMGITIVRRMTGGGAMFLQPHGAITYSLYLPEKELEGLSIRQSYEVCEAWLIRGLHSLGVDAHHVPINDIACSEGKIGGAAQARRRGMVLHHTTLAYDMDPGEMVKVLRIGREKLKDKATKSAEKRVSPLVRQTGRSREEIVAVLFASFRNSYGGTDSALSADELAEAEELVRTKYADPVWTNEYE